MKVYELLQKNMNGYFLAPHSARAALTKPPQATPKLPRRQGSSPSAAGESQAGKMSLAREGRETPPPHDMTPNWRNGVICFDRKRL